MIRRKPFPEGASYEGRHDGRRIPLQKTGYPFKATLDVLAESSKVEIAGVQRCL
jgi:hypothetical protein